MEMGVAQALSHVATTEGSEVLKAATEDLLRIFEMQVRECIDVWGIIQLTLSNEGRSAVERQDPVN